jgi:hypothetical protein
MPDCMIDRLIELLSYIPRLGPDSLDYIDPVCNIVTRVTALKLMMGYDSTIDTDVRDRSLEILVPLMELDSPRIAIRMSTVLPPSATSDNGPMRAKSQRVTRSRFFDSLIPILTTNVGRSEASTLASQILREVSKAKNEDNNIQHGLLYVQQRLIEIASRGDQRVSHLVWNFLYSIPDDEDEEEEDDDENDDAGNDEEDDDSNEVIDSD